jgi:hypothetical protein
MSLRSTSNETLSSLCADCLLSCLVPCQRALGLFPRLSTAETREPSGVLGGGQVWRTRPAPPACVAVCLCHSSRLLWRGPCLA